MPPKKPVNVQKAAKGTSCDSTKLSIDNEASIGDNSGAQKKSKPSGTVVKSRYMQTDTKDSVKSSVHQQSVRKNIRPFSPKVNSSRKPKDGISSRRSMSVLMDSELGASCLETSNLGGVFQSTVMDGHFNLPDLDLSVIKENGPKKSFEAPENDEEQDLWPETLLLSFLTAKLEHNNQKLREEAERNILAVMEKKQQLRSELNQKKRQYLLQKKQKELNDVLKLQIEALEPVVALGKTFAEEYKSFGTAIDATRHELPVKEIHIGEDKEKFLDEACSCLNQCESILQEYNKNVSSQCDSSTRSLNDMKKNAKDISVELQRTLTNLGAVSSLVSQESVLVQQSLEEEKMGLGTGAAVFLPSIS